MADSLLFDGTDDGIVFSTGAALIDSGPITLAAVVKMDADNAARQIFYTYSAELVGRWGIQLDAANLLKLNSLKVSAFSLVAADGWALLAVTKANGSVTPRFHKYVYGTSTATHEDGLGGALADGSVLESDGSVHVGLRPDGFWPFSGNMLIAGVWNSVLSDAAIEALATGGKSAWESAAPLEAWRLDTTSAISSFATGGSADETSRVGTTLDTGDAPAGWSDEPPPPLPLGLFDPDLVPAAWF